MAANGSARLVENEMTRATFLNAGMLAALAALTAQAHGVLRLPTWISWLGRDGHLRRSTYAPYLGTTFLIRQRGARSLPLRLREISDLTGKPGAEEAFALLFSGPARAMFQQDPSRIVKHPALGRFRLGIFPVGRPEGGRQHYEAIVNRLTG